MIRNIRNILQPLFFLVALPIVGNACPYWDANGNLAQIMRCMQGGARLHEWDEENRLRFVLGDRYAGCYGYDGNGDRVYKLTGISSFSQQNAGGTIAQVTFDDAVLYPNPYTVITPKGYTKHYYAGTERLATVIGGGGFGDMTTPITSLSTAERTDLVDPFWERYSPHTEDPFFYSNTLSGDMITRDIEDNCIDELQYHCSPLPLEYVDALYQDNMLFDAILDYEQEIEIEKFIYYYHGDHLGSANWITNADGDAVQYIHYAPYGELIANQIPHGYDERFKFTGKERDAESGYDFFGARYLRSATGHWMSVDPDGRAIHVAAGAKLKEVNNKIKCLGYLVFLPRKHSTRLWETNCCVNC